MRSLSPMVRMHCGYMKCSWVLWKRRHGFVFVDFVHENLHGADSRVEVQSINVLCHFLHRLVVDFVQCMVIGFRDFHCTMIGTPYSLQPFPGSVLPATDNFQPADNGESPLANVPDFLNVEIDGVKGTRETNTMRSLVSVISTAP